MTSVQIDIRDGLSSSTAIKGPVKCATTGNITLSGQQTIDGVAIVTDDRVLVKDQTTASDNGIYIADTGPWRRSKDFNKTRDVKTGTLVIVSGGTLGAGLWQVTTADPIVIGTTSIAFVLVSNASLVGSVGDVRNYLDVAPYVATLAALKALDTTKDTVALYDGSLWYWTAGNYTSRIASDPLGGIYAKADAIATGSGAWVRSFRGRAKVSWWLAGSASLTTGLAAALLVGVRLFLDAGSYTTSNVVFPSNSDLLMDANAVIAPTPAFTNGNLFTTSGADNVQIRGGQFNAPYLTFTNIACIRPTNSSRVQVRDVKVISAGTHGFIFDGCTDSLLDNCQVLEAGIYGILFNSAAATSQNNTVRKCKSINSYGGHTIQMQGGKYNLVDDCYVMGAHAFGISLYQETFSKAVACKSQRSRAEAFNLDSCYRSYFIGCSGDWNGAGGYASTDFGASINGDTVDTSFNGIINCTIDGCAKSGIAIAGATNAQFNEITGNHISNVNSLAEANKAGVLIYGGGAVNNNVTGNQINGSANMHYGVRDESTGRNVFGQNNIMNAATGNYSLNANSVTVIETTGSSKVTTGTSGHALGFLDGANVWSATQTINLSASGTALTLYTADSGAGSADLVFQQDSASPAANDVLGRILWIGRDSAANVQTYGYLQGFINDPTSTSEDFKWQWVTVQAGGNVAAMELAQGLILGNPTGGDKGGGTLNAATRLYTNNNIVPYILTGTATYDPPSLVDAAGATTTVTVTGAALGDAAVASFSLDTQGITITAWVSSANTVSVRFQNESGGTLDIASGTLKATVFK